jgi:hypothetical protein
MNSGSAGVELLDAFEIRRSPVFPAKFGPHEQRDNRNDAETEQHIDNVPMSVGS